MKKTFTINISGTVFHIEEDAFEKLQAYLQKLSSYFEQQTGGQEILQDIEARIAELLQEKMKEGNEAVTNEWVEEVMHRMGNPEDFMDADSTGDAPKNEAKAEKIRRRLYRDGESRVLGGVCSGLGAYFNIDPVFLRILFVVLVFLGAGISFFIYIILWIVVPKARTTAQRLEMRGEEATIPNIQKTIQEEVKEVRNSFSKINQSDMVQQGRKMAGKAGQASVQVAKGLGRALAVFFGSLLILLGFFGLVSFLISVAVGNSFMSSSVSGLDPDLNFGGIMAFVVSPGVMSLAILLLVLIVGITLLAILFIGTKLVFRYKTNNKLIGLGAFGIWLVAVVAAVALTLGQVGNFSHKNTVSTSKALNCTACQTLKVELDANALQKSSDENSRYEDYFLMGESSNKVLAGRPQLSIESTEGTDFSVVVRKSSRGKDAAEVQANLNKIDYTINSSDSTLVLQPFFVIGNQAKLRSQDVLITVKVPQGKQVRLGKDLDELRLNIDNLNNLWNEEMTEKTWTMTPEGLKLKE